MVDPTVPTISSLRSKIASTQEDISVIQTMEDKEKKKLKEKEILHSVKEIEAALAHLKDDVAQQENSAVELDEITQANRKRVEFNKISASFEEIKEDLENRMKIDLDNLKGDILEDQEEKEEKESDEKEGSNRKETAARVVGGGVVAVGAYKLWNWISGGKKEKKESTTSTETKEKRGWRGRTTRKVGKWLLIAGGAVAGALGLRWLRKKYSTGNAPEDPNEPEVGNENDENVKDFDSMSKERREKYNQMGVDINGFYNNIYATEIADGWEDNTSLGFIGDKEAEENDDIETANREGLVPAAIDNSFGSIGKVLSEEGLTGLTFADEEQYIIELVKQKTGLGAAVRGFIGSLEWVTSILPGVEGSWGDKIQKLFDVNPEQLKADMRLFFRQYARLLTFYTDKKDQLQFAIAKQAFKRNDGGHDTVHDAILDSEWMTKYVLESSDYKSFENSKLFDANRILEKYDLMNSDIAEKVGNDAGLGPIITELDTERREILKEDKDGNNGSIDKAIVNVETTGSIENKNELIGTVEAIKEDLEDEFTETFMFGWLGGLYGPLWQTEQHNLQKFLANSGLKEMVNAYKEKCDEKITQINNGSMGIEGLKELKNFGNDYFAFKKQCMVAGYTMRETNIEETDWVGRLYTLTGGFMTLTKNYFADLYDKITFGQGVFGFGLGYLFAQPALWTAEHLTKKIPSVGWIISGGVSKIRWPYTRWIHGYLWYAGKKGLEGSGRIIGSPSLLRRTRYAGKNGMSILVHDIMTGKCRKSMVDGIIEKRNGVARRINGKAYNTVYELIGDHAGIKTSKVEAFLGNLNDEANFLENKSFRNKVFSLKKVHESGLKNNTYNISYKLGKDDFKVISNYRKSLKELGRQQKINARTLSTEIFQQLDFKKSYDFDALKKISDEVAKIPSDKLPNNTHFKKLAHKILENGVLFDDKKSLVAFLDDITVPKISNKKFWKLKLYKDLSDEIVKLQNKLVNSSNLGVVKRMKIKTDIKSYRALNNMLFWNKKMTDEVIHTVSRLLDKGVKPGSLTFLAKNFNKDLVKILKQGDKAEYDRWIQEALKANNKSSKSGVTIKIKKIKGIKFKDADVIFDILTDNKNQISSKYIRRVFAGGTDLFQSFIKAL